MSGSRTPRTGPSPGATRRWPATKVGSPSSAKPDRRAATNASGSPTRSARLFPSSSARAKCAATNCCEATVVADVAGAATMDMLSAYPQPVAFFELALSGVASRDVGRLGGRQLEAALHLDDTPGGALDTTLRLDDPAFGANRLAHEHWPVERDAHPGRHAPAVLLDPSPGRDFVEDRRDDAAVDEAFPALETVGHRQFDVAAPGLELEREVKPDLVELAAGKAMVRADSEILVR